MQVVFDYFRGLVARYNQLNHFQIGYPDEQGGDGATPYPQCFLEAELLLSEKQAGQYTCSAALQLLDQPSEHGLNEGTRLQEAILADAGTWAEELLEQMRTEEVLQDVSLTSYVTLTDVGRDLASGCRVEISFTINSKVSRKQVRQRFTPLD